ncbi:MAG: hypothetical protein J6W36_07635 [Clostridiales bacterium]|nr:hypothetical protein [Clostridiales bacterium]
MIKSRITGALLALTILLSGCSSDAKPASSVVNVKNADGMNISTGETTAETTKEPEPFTFNPHVHCDLLSEIVTEDMWNSFYNMVDAIRAGEDTFKCTDENAYKWATDEATIGNFLPAACTIVVGDGYENGTGKLKYKMDKVKFLEREKAFEDEIVRIINEATRSDLSEFEKLVGLYDYMCKYWVYDYNELDGQGIDDFSDYACLMKKNGICCEIAGAFSYLLLQCGVQAMSFGTSCEHDWTYVIIGGKGYHCDATWALHGDSPDASFTLQYFMMTQTERLSTLTNKDQLQASWIWPWKSDYDLARFSATDDRFKEFYKGAYYAGIDTEKNVIRYYDTLGESFEISYGDM